MRQAQDYIILDSGSAKHLSPDVTVTNADKKIPLVGFSGDQVLSQGSGSITVPYADEYKNKECTVGINDVNKVAAVETTLLSLGKLIQEGYRVRLNDEDNMFMYVPIEGSSGYHKVKITLQLDGILVIPKNQQPNRVYDVGINTDPRIDVSRRCTSKTWGQLSDVLGHLPVDRIANTLEVTNGNDRPQGKIDKFRGCTSTPGVLGKAEKYPLKHNRANQNSNPKDHNPGMRSVSFDPDPPVRVNVCSVIKRPEAPPDLTVLPDPPDPSDEPIKSSDKISTTLPESDGDSPPMKKLRTYSSTEPCDEDEATAVQEAGFETPLAREDDLPPEDIITAMNQDSDDAIIVTYEDLIDAIHDGNNEPFTAMHEALMDDMQLSLLELDCIDQIMDQFQVVKHHANKRSSTEPLRVSIICGWRNTTVIYQPDDPDAQYLHFKVAINQHDPVGMIWDIAAQNDIIRQLEARLLADRFQTAQRMEKGRNKLEEQRESSASTTA